MFDRLQIRVLSQGPGLPAELRFWVNGEDVVERAVGEGGQGLFATDALPAQSPSPLRATGEARRVELGEPECSGGCCGFLSVVVQKIGDVVHWRDWVVPYGREDLPLELHFAATRYDAELSRVEADRWWQDDT
ncbi:hypothetical protein [Embleya sp. NPDC001921]